LTDLGKLEQPITPKSVTNLRSLANQVEPLVDQLEGAHTRGWVDIATMKKAEFDLNAARLGDTIENQSIAIARELQKSVGKRLEMDSAVGKAISDETSAAVKYLASLITQQKRLIERLKENKVKSSKLDGAFLDEIESIRTQSASKLDKIHEEYIKAADELEDNIESLEGQKSLQKDFNNYLMKSINTGNSSSKSKSMNKKATRSF